MIALTKLPPNRVIDAILNVMERRPDLYDPLEEMRLAIHEHRRREGVTQPEKPIALHIPSQITSEVWT